MATAKGSAAAPGKNPQAGMSKGGGKGAKVVQGSTGGASAAKPSSKSVLSTKGAGNRF